MSTTPAMNQDALPLGVKTAVSGAAHGCISAVEVHDRPSQQSASWSGGTSKTKCDSRGFACIGLHEPKCENNIGAVLRACGCYEAEMIVVAGKRYRHAPTDTQKTWKHIPLLEVDSLQMAMPKGCVAVAVDLIEGARPLTTYVHPERAFYVFGGEDRTLGPDVLAWCRDVVYVPTAHCMNLAATVNVVLYDRLAKRGMRVGLPKGAASASEGRKPPR